MIEGTGAERACRRCARSRARHATASREVLARGQARRRRRFFFFLWSLRGAVAARRRCHVLASTPKQPTHTQQLRQQHTGALRGQNEVPFLPAALPMQQSSGVSGPEHIHIFSVLFSLCVCLCAIVEHACALIRRVDDVRVPRGRGVACQAYQQLCQYAYALLTTTWAKAEAARPRS